MSRIHVMSGPFGTEAEKIAAELGSREAVGALSTLERHPERDLARRIQGGIAKEYLQVIKGLDGSSGGPKGLIQIPTFGDRAVLKEANIGLNGDGGIHTFQELVRTKAEIIQSVVNGSRGRLGVKTAISFGPKNDCYNPEEAPGVAESREFHRAQVAAVKGLDQLSHINWETFTSRDEALGAVLAAKEAGVDCIANFVLGSDGRILGAEKTGETLGDAIRHIDSVTGGWPIGYGIICTPIEGLEPALADARRAVGKREERVILVAPNASSKDVRELDGSEGIQGVKNSDQQGAYLNYLSKKYPGIKILSGCCGNDPQSIGAIAGAVRGDLFSNIVPETDLVHGEGCGCC